MKVLIPTEYYPPFVMGGGEISTKLLAEGLSKQGAEVYVVTPNYGSLKSEYSEENGVYVRRFGSMVRKLFFHGCETSRTIYRRKRALFYWFLNKYIRFSAGEFSKQIRTLHEKENFNLIHAQNIETIAGLNLTEVKCLRVAHLRGLLPFCANGGKHIDEGYCKRCSLRNLKRCLKTNRFFAKLVSKELAWRKERIKNFDHYIAVSQFIAKEVEKEGIPPDKISAIHNPVDETQISDLSKEEARKRLKLKYDKIVLYVGALTDAKGARFVLELAKTLPWCDFVVVGDGPLRPLFEREQLNLKNLHYLGQMPFEEVKNYYRASDILVVPSIWQEPFPRVVIEGQANGACVVAFGTGGIPEAIETGKTGFLAPVGDIEKLKNTVTQLLKDEKSRKTVGGQAVKKAEKEYRKDVFTKKVLDVYMGLFNR